MSTDTVLSVAAFSAIVSLWVRNARRQKVFEEKVLSKDYQLRRASWPDELQALPQTPKLQRRNSAANVGNADWLSEEKFERRGSQGAHHASAPPVPIILVTDPGQDLDDEMAMIMARHLVELEHIELRGVITTLTPSSARARLARGTLDLLGLHYVPVGIGTDGGDVKGNHTADPFEMSARSYMPTASSESARVIESGRRLLERLYKDAEENSITLLIIASQKDPALFLRDKPTLFVEKTREVVIMGGCKPVNEDDNLANVELEPDTANNNTFDKDASEYFYRECQRLGIPLVIVSRFAAYAAKMPRSVYDDIALTGSSIGWRLRNSQRTSIDSLWKRACGTEPSVRKGLPERCNREWFINTFCGGDDDPTRTGDDTAWDMVTGFMQYDTVALLASVPAIRAEAFNPLVLPPLTNAPRRPNRAPAHRVVIGRTAEDHGVVDPPKLINEVLNVGFKSGVLLNHHAQPAIILCLQLRWDNLSDTLLTCLTLRAFWDLRLASCLGIIISLDPKDTMDKKSQDDDSDESTLQELAEDVCNTLRNIGLSHIPTHIVGGDTKEQHTHLATEKLLSLYECAPPIGVTLILTSTFTSVEPFAREHSDLFRNKTVRVVHIGGVLVWAASKGWASDLEGDFLPSTDNDVTGSTLLMPDPAAQNHRLDMIAARRFYRITQALSVPLVVLSRHVAKECCIPRTFFDVLASHGGPVGRYVFQTERDSLLNLWKCASAPAGDKRRSNLPLRCDRDWFANIFCAGTVANTESEVWNSIETINLYSPIALLAALPGKTIEHFFHTMPFTVRSATHLVIGLTAEVPPRCVKQPKQLRSFLVEAFLASAIANVSEFVPMIPPPISITLDNEENEEGRREKSARWSFTEISRDRAYEPILSLSRVNVVMTKVSRKKRYVPRRRFSNESTL